MNLDKTIEFIRSNFLYLCIWAIALLTVVGLNVISKNSFTFIGVTESREININSNHAVVIKEIHVIPGQSVKEGQLLIELKRPDLETKINEVTHKLKELTSQYKLNAKLNSEMQSIDNTDTGEEDTLSIQMKALESELKILYEGQENLYIFAQFTGHIGAVNYKKGESVSPFQPLVTIHKSTPTLIRGFIHESHLGDVRVNKGVKISSVGRKEKMSASITSVGNRIVELPERFKRNPNDRVWGREVIIQIPEMNNFLLGEKVFLDLDDNSRSISNISYLKNTTNDKKDEIYQEISNRPKDNLLEPSGLIYIPELKKFLMISDESDNNRPLVYLLNSNAEMDSHVIEVDGLDKINDTESISVDELGNVYLLASQSPNKKGKEKKSRQKFVKLKRSGVHLTLDSEILLYEQLSLIAKNNEHEEWVRLLSQGKENELYIDIEGMFFANKNVYLGLRNPVSHKKEVIILQLEDIDSIFAEKKINANQVSIWKKISLPVNRDSDRNEGISDMFLLEDQLYFTTANNGHLHRGRVLVMDIESSSPKELAFFKNKKPEGISFDSDLQNFVVVFDNNEPLKTQYMTILKSAN